MSRFWHQARHVGARTNHIRLIDLGKPRKSWHQRVKVAFRRDIGLASPGTSTLTLNGMDDRSCRIANAMGTVAMPQAAVLTTVLVLAEHGYLDDDDRSEEYSSEGSDDRSSDSEVNEQESDSSDDEDSVEEVNGADSGQEADSESEGSQEGDAAKVRPAPNKRRRVGSNSTSKHDGSDSPAEQASRRRTKRPRHLLETAPL